MSANLITSRAVIGSFYAALDQGANAWVNNLSFKVNSNQASEQYAWLGMAPAMREWLGGRSAVDLREFSYTLANKEHEATLEVTVPELRRDKTGQLLIRINELADRVNAYPAKLMSTLINNAEAATCYDGQFFFDTDHAEGDSGSQSNDLTYAAATGTTPTVAEMRGAIMAMLQAMLGFKDDRGEPMNENAKSFTIMTPLTYWATAIEAVNLPTVENGGVNLLQNLSDGISINVIPNVRLTGTTKLYAFRNDGRVKPFILQEEMPVSIKAVAEGSELEFNEKKHRYGVDWSGNVGYGYWQHACLTTFT
jgi:phage major head subunit gpT-like protein